MIEKALLEKYLAEGLSLPKIGRLVDRPPGTVGYWVKRHGLVANGAANFRQKGPLDRVELSALVGEGLSLREIAEELGTTINRVARWIGAYGLGPTHRGRRASSIREAREAGEKEIFLDCPKHGLTAFWIGSRTARCRKCNSAGVARRRRRVKEILVREAGGSCALCEFDRFPESLEFHHLDPAMKSFGLSAAGISRSLAKSRMEVEKCILLCANCHAAVEKGSLEVPVTLSQRCQ